MRWWPLGAVAGLSLHYGFAGVWPTLHDMIVSGG